MGFKVVGFVGSPRKGMNTDTLVTKVLEGARSKGAGIEKIYLNDLEIKPCQACNKSPTPAYCFFKDGMEIIYQTVDTADAIVIGTPAYYDSISSQLKLAIDRCNCFSDIINLPDDKFTFKSKVTKQKKGIFIWVAGSSRNPEHALAMINLWCKDAKVDLIETMIVTEADRGEGARKRVELLHKAFELGKSLVH
jgi:multimeric flavodoxin WrbA